MTLIDFLHQFRDAPSEFAAHVTSKSSHSASLFMGELCIGSVHLHDDETVRSVTLMSTTPVRALRLIERWSPTTKVVA